MLTRKEFGQLFDEYFDDITAFLFMYSSDRGQIKDWTQEIFIKLWLKRDKIDFGHPGLRGYLLKTARNHALKKLQKNKKYELWLDDNLRKLTGTHYTDHIEINTSSLEKSYSKALTKIPPRARKAYLLNRNEGLTYTEIAKVMGISVKTVETQIGNALRILRNELKDFFHN